jgi:hypothetical protein
LLPALLRGGVALLGPPVARALISVTIRIDSYKYQGDIPYWIPLPKSTGDPNDQVPIVIPFDTTTTPPVATTYDWTGNASPGVMEDSHGPTGYLAIPPPLPGQEPVLPAGTVNVAISGVADPNAYPPPWGSCTSTPFQVFDADLKSPAVDDDHEMVAPTFVGPGCTKQFMVKANPAVGGLPVPTHYPAYDGGEKHWLMSLTIDDAPGLSFRDENDNPIVQEAPPGLPHEPLRTFQWGWVVRDPDGEHAMKWWGHPVNPVYPIDSPWRQGETPPEKIWVGSTGGQSGVPKYLTLTLTIWHNRGTSVATDSILIVPVGITQTPERSVGDDRNLWYFGLNHDDPHDLNQPANYPVKLTLAAPQMPDITGSANFVYDWNTTYNGGGRINFQDALGSDAHYRSDAGDRDVLVFAHSASSSTEDEDHHDIDVKLTIADQDAAVAELTVYVPYAPFLFRQPRGENETPNPHDENGGTGYNTFYYFLPCDQFRRSLPRVGLEQLELFHGQHAVPPYTDLTYDWPEPDARFISIDGNGFQDQFGREGLLRTPVPINPVPWQPLVDQPVCDGYQDYLVGTTVHGNGIILHTHTIHWYRGKARIDPEPPFGQGTP